MYFSEMPVWAWLGGVWLMLSVLLALALGRWFRYLR